MLTEQPAPATPVSPVRSRIPALVLAAVLVTVCAAAVLSLRPAAARPASAPANEFSASRAMAVLGGIATVPHPVGSPAQAAVRGHLVDELRRAGLVPEVGTGSSSRVQPGRTTSAGTVSNIHAVVPGRDPTGRVLLVAHYDSVPTGPGASDDGVNVAAILEIARIVVAGPQPRNDVEILLTDGEEQGLLGARAFVASGVGGDPGRVVVLNLEARGVSGPAVMFQMAGTGLTPTVRAAGAVTTSVADAVYGLLPNDTDLTVFAKAGMRGLNFAFLNGAEHYHRSDDDIAHVDPASVQDMGDAALAGVRELADADLTPGPDSQPDTWFSLFGPVVSYPAGAVLPLALAAAIGFGLVLARGRRHGLAVRGIVRAASTFAVCVVAAVVVGAGTWSALAALRPDLDQTGGTSVDPAPFIAAQAVVLVAVVLVWLRFARKRASAVEVALGVLAWFCLLAVVAAVFLPGGAYLVTWPALIGVTAIAVTLPRTEEDSPWRVLAAGAGAVPAMALLTPVALLLVPALGLATSGGPLLLVALVAGAAAAAVDPLPRPRVLTAMTLVPVLAAVAVLGILVAVDGYGPDRPRPVSLGYLLDADRGSASWIGLGGAAQPVSGPLLTGVPVRLDATVPMLGGGLLDTGPAPLAAGVGRLRTEVLAMSGPDSDGVRDVRVRVRAPAGAYSLEIYTNAAAVIAAHAGVGADRVDLGSGPNRSAAADGGWRWGFAWAAPPPEGLELGMRVRGEDPIRLSVVAAVAGLPDGVGPPVLPPDASFTAWPSPAGQTFVVSTVNF